MQDEVGGGFAPAHSPLSPPGQEQPNRWKGSATVRSETLWLRGANLPRVVFLSAQPVRSASGESNVETTGWGEAGL